MLRVADCLVQTHDPKLVLIAVAVCVFASLTSFSLLSRALAESRLSNAWVWLLLAAVTASSGVWATHFIAMLAFQPPIKAGYEVVTTVVSFVVAVAVTGCALLIVFLRYDRLGRLTGGILLGLATVAMHYTGVSGLRIQGSVTWDPAYVAASALLSVAFALPALLSSGRGETFRERLGGAALFALSIVSLHFTGMAAITLVPDPSVALPETLLSGDVLAVAIGGVTLLIVGCAFAAWLLDRRLQRESDGRLRFMARHDTLTSLPNRVLFEEIVKREITLPLESSRKSALLCLDLDGFKAVNDIFGHAAGDHILVEVARRLQGLLGERCVAARLGGDEFAILATALNPFGDPENAAERVIDALAAPFEIEGSHVDIGCSIGIARFPADADSYETLLSRADLALGRAKNEGRGVFRFFEARMDDAVRDKRRLAQDLRAAIGTGQISLEYQPQVDVESGETLGFEALVRWDHPTRGRLSPGVFIPLAEETGIILPLGEWVLREACREAATWQAPLRIAVNLSVAQFRQTGLTDRVRAILAETGLPAERLEIEVTESLFFDATSRASETLRRIAGLGVRIAMDDFGTGYSSLSTLQSFAFDTLKIDRSFTDQIGKTRKGTAIVRAILGLGDSLGMTIVAEGVETTEQLAFLREHGCREIQGYLCGRPRPIGMYGELLTRTIVPSSADVIRLRIA